DDANFNHIKEADVALQKALVYFRDRASGNIPQNLSTVSERADHLNRIFVWVSPLLNYYRIILSNTIIGEINGYRQAVVDTKKTKLVDKTEVGARVLSQLATPELNEALNVKPYRDDNIIRTSIPLKRISDSDFPDGFKLAQFVQADVDKAPNRL